MVRPWRIEDHHVGKVALTQQSASLQAPERCKIVGHLADCLLQRQRLTLAHPIAQYLGRMRVLMSTLAAAYGAAQKREILPYRIVGLKVGRTPALTPTLDPETGLLPGRVPFKLRVIRGGKVSSPK